MPPFQPHDLPVDILPPILSHLHDRKDWHTCTLVSKTFCRVATPFLYHTLDSRVISKTWVHHPCTTLLARPELARYVRRVTETGAVHRGMHLRYPTITQDALSALSLCTNLQSMTWIDGVSSRTSTSEKLLAFIAVIRRLPVRELTIRTHTDLGEQVWSELITLTGLHKVSIWCMEGPPRVLQGWSGPLGSSLTHLELGRCAGVPPTILITVLAQLPLLQDLRLKGAPATAIPTILTFLPNLKTLDTEFLLSGSGTYYSAQRSRMQTRTVARTRGVRAQQTRPRTRSDDVTNPNLNNSNTEEHDNDNDNDQEEDEEDDLSSIPPDPPIPTLQKLTVRATSMDNLGPQQLWPWIRDLIPLPSLRSFRLHAFAFAMGSSSGAGFGFRGFRAPAPASVNANAPRVNIGGMGGMGGGGGYSERYTGLGGGMGSTSIDIPRSFILEMAAVHGRYLTEFDVGEASLTLGDVECLATKLERLEVLVCALACPDVASIVEAISPAKNMHTLKLQVTWIPTLSGHESESESGSGSDLDSDLDMGISGSSSGFGSGEEVVEGKGVKEKEGEEDRRLYASGSKEDTNTDTNTDTDMNPNPKSNPNPNPNPNTKPKEKSKSKSKSKSKTDTYYPRYPHHHHHHHYRQNRNRNRNALPKLPEFTLEDARSMMMGPGPCGAGAAGAGGGGSSKLRVISVGAVRYTGKWVLEQGQLKFVVSSDVAEDKWKT